MHVSFIRFLIVQIIKSLHKSIILHIFSAPLQIKRYITSYAPIYSQTKRNVWYVPSFPSLKTWCQVQFRHCNGAWKYWTYEDLVKFLYHQAWSRKTVSSCFVLPLCMKYSEMIKIQNCKSVRSQRKPMLLL